MRSAIFLVTALVAASTATPWGSRANQQCASYCRETSKFQYSVGTIYSYDYSGETASKIGGTSEQESRLHIGAQAEFEVVSQCEFVLRLKRVTLEQSDPQDGSARSLVAGSTHFAAALEQHPMLFSFQDGHIEHVCPSVDEPVWSLNIKRAILSALQNSMQDLTASQKVFETDIVGHCETNYTVESQGRSDVVISRSKDLLACTGRNGHHSSPILSTPYSSASSIQSLPLLRSENECRQTIRNRLLESSVCTESHLFRPFSNGQSGATTRITQKLSYNSERRSDQVPTDYKRKKANLVFVDADWNRRASGLSLAAIEETLNSLVQDSKTAVSPRTPALFSSLVHALRPLSYVQLTELFAKTLDTKAKKYLMDAAPLVNTAASYAVMRDLIQEGLLSDLETDMWLISLAFQPKPTLDMLSSVSPLLADNPVRPKAMLSISALIHAYCRSHAGCRSEDAVREAIRHIENRIGIACRSRDEDEQKNILLALKALGNAGVIVSSTETLKKCYQEENNSMTIRLAAIDAFRRVPCHLDDRSSLMSFFRQTKQDSELRIGAYLGAMQCPSGQLLEEVKLALTRENVNQVGSFIWTHLTNLQETSSPSKQAVRQLLASDFLRNKFNTDARKFSRNLEVSTYWPESNVGGSAESNIIFSSQSYLPRSATLNLTLDLFGQSVNLLELGARLEGFESTVESLFGPNGLFPDDTIQKVLESMRGKRSAVPVDQQPSLNQLSTIFDVRGQLADQPQGDLYLRIFGHELQTHRFQGLDPFGGNSFAKNPLAGLLKTLGQKDIDASQSVSMMDVSYVIPTMIGLPLTLKVNATATMALKMAGTFQTASLDNLNIQGHIKPSATVEINGLMSVDASTFGQSGVHVQNTMHTSTGLSGKLIVQGRQIVSVQLDAPEEAANTFSIDSRLFLLQQSGRNVAVQPDQQQRPRIAKKSCSPSWLSRTFGAELCAELDFWPRTKTGPRGPLAGPAHVALFLRKTDSHNSYRLDYNRQGLRSISLVLDTPESTVNRQLSAQLTVDELASSLRATLSSPLKTMEISGSYDYNPLLKGADLVVKVNGAELASFRTALRSDLKGLSGRYEPSLVISQRGREMLHFQGYFNYVANSKYGFDFQLKQLTVRPIRLTGDVSKDNDKHEWSLGLKSYLLDATLASTTRLSEKLTTSKTKIGYSVMEGTSHSVEMSGKFSRAVKGSLKKTTLAGIMQSTQWPQYNGDLSWDLQQSENYVENNVRLNTGEDLWEVQQLFSGQPRDINVRLAVVCKRQQVDWLVATTFQNTETTLSSHSILRLSPGRQWSGQLDLIRQDDQPGRRYGGRIELSCPTSSRQWRADMNQELDTGLNVVIDYSLNQKTEASVLAVYHNASNGIQCDHALDIKIRSWMADELDLDGRFVASLTDSSLSLNGRYGDKKSSASLEYQNKNELEHSINVKIIGGQDVPVFQADLSVNTGDRKSLTVDIQSDRRITLDATLSAKTANIRLYWNRDVDLTQSFEWSSQLSATGGEAQFQCAGRPPVRISVDKIGQDLKIQLEWRDNQAIVLLMELGSSRTAGLLTTPFDGIRRITFDSRHKCSKTAVDTQLTIDWQKDRFTLSMAGDKTAESVQGSVQLTSSFAQLETIGLNFEAISSQPLYKYGLAVQHQGRRAELSADFRRKGLIFSGASIKLATPINGYENLKASVSHDQQIGGGFQSNLKLEGPFASVAAIDLSGRNVKPETSGTLAVTTTFSVLDTLTTSFQLFNTKTEKKLSVTGTLNGQTMAARASSKMSVGKLRSDLYINTPFSEDVTGRLEHQFDGQSLQSQGLLSWAGNKYIKTNFDGQFTGNKKQLNATLAAPGWLASARLDHKKMSGKLDTLVEAELNGKKAVWTLEAQHLEVDRVRLDTKLATPFQGLEDLRLNVQHHRDGRKAISRLVLARQQAEMMVEHDIEYLDLFNWANRLAVRTPFEGISSLTVDSKQSWTGRGEVQHDGQLVFNGKTVTVGLKVDASRPGILTAGGSLATSWSEDVFFDLKHTDDGLEFHPALTIRTGTGQPIHLETAYRRGPINPSLIVQLTSSLSDPLKLTASYLNGSPVKAVTLDLNWNGNENIKWTLDWALDTYQSTVRTRLSTPFSRYPSLEGDLLYDLTGQKKTGTILLRRGDQTILLDAFASGQGSDYVTEMVISSPFYETVKASAVLDLAGARASLKLERGSSQISLQGFLTVEATQTSVTATLETPFDAVRLVTVAAALKAGREFQLDLDYDGQKMSLTGSHSSGPAKGSLRGALKTPFLVLRSGTFDATYDASGTTKTASLTLSKNDQVVQASAQIVLSGPAIQLALNIRAPCCGVHQLGVTGSYDEMPAQGKKTGHLTLDCNGEKYQLDGHLIRNDGTAEVALKSITGHLGYEQVVVNAKYDVRQPTKTASLAFSKNQDRFKFDGTASTGSVVVHLSTPIELIKSVKIDGRYDWQSAALVLVRNDETIQLTASGSLTSSQGKLDCALETPYSGYEKLQAELVYDLKSARKFISLDAGTIRAEIEWNGRRLAVRSSTPIVGYEKLELIGDYALDDRQLLAAIFYQQNGRQTEMRFNGLYDPDSNEASFEFQSPVPLFRTVSSKLKWNLDRSETKSFHLQAANNDRTMELNGSGRFVLDHPALTLAARSNVDGWKSASFSATYDIRSSVSASLNVEKNGVHQALAGQAAYDKESVILSVQTPFEGMRTMAVSGKWIDASRVNISTEQTASLHVEKDGFVQDYGLSFSFDAKTAAVSVRTPFANYENMSAKVQFQVLGEPVKTIQLVLNKNQHRVELNGQTSTGLVELTMASTLAGYEKSAAVVRYDLKSWTRTGSLKLSLNDETIQLNGSVQQGFTRIQLDLTTPWNGYRHFTLNSDVQLTAKTARMTLVHDGQHYELSATLTDRQFTANIKTPFSGYQSTDIISRWNGQQLEFDLVASPLLGKISLAGEYDISTPVQFGRITLTHNGFRYRNELVTKLGNPWTAGQMSLNVQLPVDGLRNVTSSLNYDLVPVEKTLTVTLDNAAQHYETMAKVSWTSLSSQAVVQVQTPLPSWEELDFAAGYDLSEKTISMAGERNGRSFIFIQGKATLTPTSSIVASSIRVPALLNDDVEMMAAYSVGAESADAKIKFCAHEILFDGRQTNGWTSALATISTTFDQLQTAQISWNWTDKTASFHFNNLKAKLDGQMDSPLQVALKATLSAPYLGSHTAELGWNKLSDKFTSRAEYQNGQGGRFGTNGYVHFTMEKGDYQLTFQTGQAGLEDIQLKGSWTAAGPAIKTQSALHWAGIKQFEAVFDGDMSPLRSTARIHLISPHIRPVTTQFQYDLLSVDKSVRMDFNSMVRLNSSLTVESILHWNGHLQTDIFDQDYALAAKCHMAPGKPSNEISIRLEGKTLPTSQFRMKMEQHLQRMTIEATAQIPALLHPLVLRGYHDASGAGLKSGGSLSWTKDKKIESTFVLNPTLISAEVLTPFVGLEATRLSVKYDLGRPEQKIDSTLEWSAGRSVSLSAEWQFEDGLIFSVRLTTPFQGFEDVGLRGSFLSGSDYHTTLSYSRAGKKVDIQGKLTTNAAGSVAKITFAGDDELLSAVVEYDVRLPKKTASLTVTRGGQERMSITAAGEFADKTNAILTIETSSTNPIRLSVDVDLVATEKNGRITLEYGQQQKLELIGGWTSSKLGSKFRLAAQTPFDGMKKILLNGRFNQKAFDASFEYGRNRKVQLNGQYRWDEKMSVYSVNGTLSTPWLEQRTLSAQSYLELANGAHGFFSFSPASAGDTYSLGATYRPSGMFEAVVQTPWDVIRTGKVSAVLESDPRRSTRRLAAGGEYNGRQASIEARLAGHNNGRSVSMKGSWNNRVMTIDSTYQKDTPTFKMAVNVTTPFQGLENWAGRFERIKKGQQCDVSVHLATPLAAIPSVDASLETFIEPGKRLDVSTWLSAMGHSGRARLQAANNLKTYLASLELDIPSIEIMRAVNIRAECQVDGWKNIVSTVTAGVPAGEYTVKGSMLLGKSSLNVNAGIKTPSYAQSIEMGAGYNADAKMELVQGEVFIWDNKVEGRYEKRANNQINAELSFNLPDLKLSHIRINLETNYRSAQQLQASVSLNAFQQTHTASLAYQLAGSKLTAQLDLDTPLFQTKKGLSVKINYGNLAALTFDGRFVDGQSICELTGSLRLTGQAVHSQAKLSCPMFGSASIELSGHPTEGHVAVTIGKSVHRLGYKLNLASGGYDLTVDAQSPAIQPLHVRGIWMVSDVQQGQVSLAVRYGNSSHSMLADYLRTGGDRTAASLSVSSPLMPKGQQANIQVQYQPFDLNVQMELLGQSHRLAGSLQRWPTVNAKVQLDSPVLPWKTMGLQAQAERSVRDLIDGRASLTANYGTKNLTLAGNFRFAKWSDFEGSVQLETPFRQLTNAQAGFQLHAPDAQRVNVTVHVQSSHPILPQATFNAQYHISRTLLEISTVLVTPLAGWETVGLAVSIPLTYENAKAAASLTLPGSEYSATGMLTMGRRQFLTGLQVDYAGRRFSADVIFKADEIYQAKIDVKTPVQGFETYSWDIKGQANVRRWGEATAFLDWNGKRIEFNSNVKVEPMAYIAVVQLNTPFAHFERYAVHLRLEGTDRKTLQVEVESPAGIRVGADFDYAFNSPTDFVAKASIRTPLAGYESFTIHLSNQLGQSSYSAAAEARFADYGLAASMVGLVRPGGFQAQMDGRYNDRVIVLKASGSLDDKRVTSNVQLTTPFEALNSLESFVQLEKDMAESKGFGLSLNGRQLILVSLAKQSDGLQVLTVKNPWRPIDVSYSWQNGAHLINYHVQLCWDLNRRSSATLGGQLVVKTSSYGRKITLKTTTPFRQCSLDYALELTSTKIDHSVSVSWAANKTAGYRVMADNGSTRQQTQLGGSIRLDLPVRSFQLAAGHVGGESTSTSIDFKWDVARDPSKHMGARLETRQARHARLVLLHPELEQDIVLQGEYNRIHQDDTLTAKMELIYSPLPEHRLSIEGRTGLDETSGRSIQLSIYHPASKTDLSLEANGKAKTATTAGEWRARLDYKDRSVQSKFIQLAARMAPIDGQVYLEARTADTSLALTNSMAVSGTLYALASRTAVNDVDSFVLDARLETSPMKPTLQLDGSYGQGGQSFHILAGMPDRRQVTLRAVRDIHGRQITDGLFQLKLNQTDLLSTRVYWRAASPAELRRQAVNGLVHLLATCQSLADDLADFVAQEWADKRSALAPAARLVSKRLTDSMNGELDLIRSECQKMANEWTAMYQRNDFYLQDLALAAGQMASLAQPFFDRAVINIQAISRAVVSETTTFYRAAVKTYDTLSRTALNGWQQLSSYVSGGVTEAARSYSQLAGQVMSRLVQLEAAVDRIFRRMTSLFDEYAGRLETVVMEQVELFRIQMIDMANSYAEQFRPYTQYFDECMENVRVFYVDMLDNIEDGRQLIHKYLMAYAPFQRLYAYYLEYASWLEEFHAQDHIDNAIKFLQQLKKEMMEQIKAVTARYQPLIDPVVQAVQGQVDALKQLPVFAYMSTVTDRVYQQLNEFYKYVELEAKLRQILRDALRHTDRLTVQLVNELKGSLTFPLKPTVVIDWESGRLEYSQKLPFTWEDFGQLPRLRELPLLRKIASAKRNLIREMDYSQFYFSTMNALATYRPMKIQSIFPPFGSRAFVAGTQHYMTFDRRFYEFAGECSYLLASDFLRNDFSAVVNYEGAGGKVIRKSLTVLSDGRQIEIDSSRFRVTMNGRKIEMPLAYDNTLIRRDGQRLIVTNSRSGFKVDCNLYHDICSVHVSGWSFGKTGGLFGVYNNEPADDFLTPFRQQRTDQEVDSFANSWKVGTSRCRVRNFAAIRPTLPNERNVRLCDQLFADEKSVLRPCFQMIDPEPFARMCLNDLAAMENSPKKETAVCTAASAYADECRFAGLDLFVPPQCVRCELEDGQVIGSGEVKTFNNDAPRSADVVFIVDQKPCLNGTRLSHLPSAIDAALRERGIQQNRFAVVGYGGRGGQTFQQPHVRTADGGQIWSNRKGIQPALEDLPLAETQTAAPSDIHAALRYAINLPYRVGVSKQFVLISCGGSECQAGSYADALTLLIENDVTLHLLQPRDIIVKGKNSSEELKNVFGFDAEEVYTVRNIRSLKGDRELRRQLALPKDFCTPLALETNGTLFDLKKMMPAAQQQQQLTKKFVDVVARRIAATGEPSPCQRCDCIGDRDGIGSILCQRCVSPVLERLDKVWQQLAYENEMEIATNVEDVTVAQLKDSVATTPLLQ